MAKCQICGRKTWFFQTSQCECRAQQKKHKSIETHPSVRGQSSHLPRAMGKTTGQQRPPQSTDMTDLYLLQQQQNLINTVVSEPEPCRMTSDFYRPIQFCDTSPSESSSSSSSDCSSSSSWDSGSDSSSSSSGD
jgi:hypothetical protein